MFKSIYVVAAISVALSFGGSVVMAQDAMAPAVAPTSQAANPAPRDPALKGVFKDFGGKPGLVLLMNDFMDNLVADPRTKPFFENADRKHIKSELVDQFCVILDGPCTYTGKDMKAAHAKLGLDRANFNALVEDLQVAMSKHNIPFRSQNKLLAKLAPMHREVVTK